MSHDGASVRAVDVIGALAGSMRGATAAAADRLVAGEGAVSDGKSRRRPLDMDRTAAGVADREGARIQNAAVGADRQVAGEGTAGQCHARSVTPAKDRAPLGEIAILDTAIGPVVDEVAIRDAKKAAAPVGNGAA